MSSQRSRQRFRCKSPEAVLGVSPDVFAERMAKSDQRIATLSKQIEELSQMEEESKQEQREGSRSKQVSREDLGRIVERLHRPVQRKADTPPIPGFVQRTIDASQREDLVNRLGDLDVVNRVQKKEEAQQQEEENAPCARIMREREAKGGTVKMTPDEIEACGNRLSKLCLQRKEENVKKLRAVLLKPVVDYQKKISKSVIDGAVARVYDQSVDHKAKTKAVIFERYVATTESPKKKLKKEVQDAMADRLSKLN